MPKPADRHVDGLRSTPPRLPPVNCTIAFGDLGNTQTYSATLKGLTRKLTSEEQIEIDRLIDNAVEEARRAPTAI